MTNKTRRGITIVIVLLIATMLATFILYNKSFRQADANSSASKKVQKENVLSDWEYTKDDVKLGSDAKYREMMVEDSACQYRVLVNVAREDDGDTMVIYSDRQNKDYQSAVKSVAKLLRKKGFSVHVKKGTMTQIKAYVHAGHYGFFLMSKEKLDGENQSELQNDTQSDAPSRAENLSGSNKKNGKETA